MPAHASRLPARLPRQAVAGIALVILLHLALVWLATRPVRNPVPHDTWVWVTRLPPPEMNMPIVEPWGMWEQKPPPAGHGVHRQPAPAAGSRPPSPADSPASSSAPSPAPAPVSQDAEERALPDSPDTPTFKADSQPATDAVARALKSAGAIDRQLRAEHPQQFSAPPDTPHARFIKGLEAAHAAVGPKWFEAARTELVSAPNDPKKIYKVTTAAGSYCLYFPDKASISANSDPKSGWAGFGQPTMADCPHPF
jgi:hypothetical protein